MIRAAPMRKPRPPSPSEHALQRSVAQYLRIALRPPVFWTSVDAGAGKLTAAAAGAAKGRGCKAGLPDVWVIAPADMIEWLEPEPVASLVIAIELKTKVGRLSPVQVATHAALTKAGVLCFIARSVEEVEAILAGHGVPLRARSLPFGARAA